jgi:hypothetical protein
MKKIPVEQRKIRISEFARRRLMFGGHVSRNSLIASKPITNSRILFGKKRFLSWELADN